MDMASYVAEIEHAVSSIIPLIWSEQALVDEAAGKLRVHEIATERGYEQAAAFMDDLDDDGLATAIYWDTYFGSDKDRHHAAIELANVRSTFEARSFSRSSLASALLQYAKQGLSLVHGGLAGAPAGRNVSGINLKDLIWQGRNQALHWEEGNPRPPVEACFVALNAADAVFGDYKTKNLAFEVVRLLDWKDVESFERDMRSLG